MATITHNRLVELLSYDQESGHFTWIKVPGRVGIGGSNRVAGQRAGCITAVGYRSIGIDGRVYLEHRLAWFYVHKEWPPMLDHINRDKADNRLANLRTCTNAQNAANRGVRASSGFKGVHRTGKKWQGQVKHEGKSYCTKSFDSPESAWKARKELAVTLQGQFASTEL